MVFKETPIVDGIERRLSFSGIEWIEKELFESMVVSAAALELIPSFVRNKDNSDDRLYIGKYIPREKQSQTQLQMIRSETIGQVEKDSNGQWKLVVLCDYCIYEIKSDFSVLTITSADSCHWIESELDKIPKYALKAAIDEQLQEFVYIAATIPNTERYCYSDGWQQFPQQEKDENAIGRLRISDKALHVVVNNTELKYDKHKVFCLKPTPASLKELCRLAIRDYTHNTNVNIKSLISFVPKMLINYLKYPSCLNIGDYFLKGEKLISLDDKYELYIDHDNYLVCRNSLTNSCLILYNRSFVDAIWLQRLQTIFFYSQSPKFFLASIFSEQPLLYKFELCTKQMHPRFLFQVFNSNTKPETTATSPSCNSSQLLLYNYFSHYDETYLKYFLDNAVN